MTSWPCSGPPSSSAHSDRKPTHKQNYSRVRRSTEQKRHRQARVDQYYRRWATHSTNWFHSLNIRWLHSSPRNSNYCPNCTFARTTNLSNETVNKNTSKISNRTNRTVNEQTTYTNRGLANLPLISNKTNVPNPFLVITWLTLLSKQQKNTQIILPSAHYTPCSKEAQNASDKKGNPNGH